MTISCFQGAKTLVQLADADPDKKGLSNLQIQKILYFANMLHIGKYGANSPLVKEPFLPWPYGPAIDALYERLKEYDGDFVTIEAFDDILSIMDANKKPVEEKHESHVEVLRSAYGRWGGFEPYKLIGISHWRKGAWKRTLDNKGKKIENNLIKDEFDARYQHAG